jgi:DNA-binding transcriptional MerR regulator
VKYPFTPAILDALPEELSELFRGLELKLLEEICSRLKIADQLNEVTVQDIRALRAHGIDLEDIKKAIREATGTGAEKLDKLLDDVVSRNQRYYTEMVDLAAVTAPDRLVSEADIAAIRRQTWGAYKNITGSMGFLTVQGGRLVISEPAKVYERCLDNALMQIQSGAISYNQAISEQVKTLADRGLCVAFDNNGNLLKNRVAYESGHIDQLDVAVRRAVMTGVSQICDQYDTQSMEYLDTPYCEISAHSGARDIPKPNPWSSHKGWQGRVYYQSKKGEPDPLGKYPDLVQSTGYGYVDGLKGANCRHRKFAWLEGVSERTYTDKELANIDPPPITFEGRTYTAYQATQKQRQIERTVRKLRRRKTAFEAAGLTEDAQAANIRLRRLNQEYKEFSKAAGLPEQRERMRVEYPGDITDIKKFAPLKEYRGYIRVVGQFSAKEYVVKLDPPTISGVTQHFSDNLITRPDRAGLTIEAAQGIINSSKIVLYQPSNSTLKFLADNGYAVLNMQGKIVTAVPEKLRKKYRDYLEGK